jgi:ubiquinone/menaquinone biosynthesis C-methylase UbiE
VGGKGGKGRKGRKGNTLSFSDSVLPSSPSSLSGPSRPQGHEGWDEYAPFYDWENARTLGRRDVAFWRRFAEKARGPVLELGSGTGRITLPLAEAGIEIVGIDRSERMLERALRLARPEPVEGRARSGRAVRLVRADIRSLPFRAASFASVLAPYGVLQSLTTSRDLTATLKSVARVLPRGGTFGLDLVPDVAKWEEYSDRRRFHGRDGDSTITLFETVRRDRKRRLTIFHERYVVQRNGERREHRFDLTFRTLPMREMARLLRQTGFAVDATIGDYRHGPWHAGADVWILLAKKV